MRTASPSNLIVIAAVGLVALALGAASPVAAVTGQYLEARTADVYTGPCFANSEVDLAGKEAILAWRVTGGELDGVDLSDLSVVAVVAAHGTLGDPYEDPQPARSVLLVDERANAAQRRALVDLAREMGGELLAHVHAVEAAPIEMSVGSRPGYAHVKAGAAAELSTRGLTPADHLCGNEIVYYDPLTPTVHATPAVTLVHRFAGDGLGVTWSSPAKRSAFVGTFSH